MSEKPKRKKQRVMMHVRDYGYGTVMFACDKCHEFTDWLADDRSESEDKKGIPCTVCNTDLEPDSRFKPRDLA